MPGESSSHSAGRLDPLPVLTTKLYRSPLPPDVEIRSELLQLLEENRHRPLTLISAAAGYGKTANQRHILDHLKHVGTELLFDQFWIIIGAAGSL